MNIEHVNIVLSFALRTTSFWLAEMQWSNMIYYGCKFLKIYDL